MTVSLSEWLRAAERRRFRPGRWDCVRFAAGWVRRATGRDVLANWRYRSLAQGRALLVARGLADLAAGVDAELPRIPVLMAGAGDVAMVGEGLGIVTGAQVVCLRRGGGLQAQPLTDACAAWRVI